MASLLIELSSLRRK